jgi:hypothetical protein
MVVKLPVRLIPIATMAAMMMTPTIAAAKAYSKAVSPDSDFTIRHGKFRNFSITALP